MLLIFLVNTHGVIPLKYEKGTTINNAFKKILKNLMKNQTNYG